MASLPLHAGGIPLQPLQTKETGYPALASVMGPFARLAIYKRFASLNSYNLLLRQAELLHLEQRLRVCISVDTATGLNFHESVQDMLDAADAGAVRVEQWELVLEVRTKLEAYNAALLQQAEMAKLSRPRKYDLHLLRDWLARPKGGNNFLGPGEDRPWVEGTENDLVAISKSNYDSLTYWVEERVVPWAARCGILRRQPVRGYEAVGLREWSDTTFFAMSKTFSIVMSTAIPSAAIIALYSIHHMLHRILAASLLTLVFSVALAVTTSARPAELFVATAAFTAVLVVFIGSTDKPS